MYIIGIDPGPIAGVVRLGLLRPETGTTLTEVQALQGTPGLLTDLLNMLTQLGLSAIAYEQFVVGPRAARSATHAAGARARNMVGAIESWALDVLDRDLFLHQRPAAMVKPWATDERLDAAGLLEPTKGMRHARDAARHALFCAVRDYGLPDPLSRSAR